MGHAGVRKRRPCLSLTLKLSSRDPPVSTPALELQTRQLVFYGQVRGELQHFAGRATAQADTTPHLTDHAHHAVSPWPRPPRGISPTTPTRGIFSPTTPTT